MADQSSLFEKEQSKLKSQLLNNQSNVDNTKKNAEASLPDGSPRLNERSIHSLTCEIISDNPDAGNYDLSYFVTSVEIIKDFEKCIKPIYVLEFFIPLKVYKYISKIKQYKYRLQILSARNRGFSMDASMDPVGASGEKFKSCDVFLIPFNLPENKIKDLESIELSNPSMSSDTPTHKYRVECFDMRHIQTSYKFTSATYRNTPFSNIVIDLLNKFKDMGPLSKIENLVFLPCDNEETKDVVSLPPMTLKEQLEHLQETYNLYNRRLMFFLDDETCFICKRAYTTNVTLKDYNAPENILIVYSQKLKLPLSEYQAVEDILNNRDQEIYYISTFMDGLSDKSAQVINSNPDKLIVKSDTTNEGIQSTCFGIKDGADLLTNMKNNPSNPVINTIYSGKEQFIKKNNSSTMDAQLLMDKAQSEAFDINVFVEDTLVREIKPTTKITLMSTLSSNKNYEGNYYIKKVVYHYRMDLDAQAIKQNTVFNLGRMFDDSGKPV